MIHKEFAKMLKEEGVEKIECLDKKFTLISATRWRTLRVGQRGRNGAEVYQPGYKFNGKLMRAAKVKVSKAPEIQKNEILEDEKKEEKADNNENKEENK